MRRGGSGTLRVLLTGATGFIGSQIARELLDRGHVVRALVRRGSDRYRIEDIAARLELAEADLFEAPEQELARLAQGTDLCVHAAWYAEPGLYLASPENLRCMHASLKLMEGLAHAGSRRAVFLGSCFEYDFGPEPLSEEKPLNPRSVYAAAKVATWLVGRELARLRGVSFAWARPFYQYGPFERPQRLTARVIHSLLRGEPVPLTQGTHLRDYLHVRDVAGAVVAIAVSDLEGAVNVGSGRPVTVRHIASTIESLMDRKGLVQFGARPESPTEPPCVWADRRKLVEGTGWSPRFDLRDGLQDTIDWTRRHLGRSSVASG